MWMNSILQSGMDMKMQSLVSVLSNLKEHLWHWCKIELSHSSSQESAVVHRETPARSS